MRRRRVLDVFRVAGPHATIGTVALVLGLLALGALGLEWQQRVVLDDERLSGEILLWALGIIFGAAIAVSVAIVAFSRGKGPARRQQPPTVPSLVTRLAFLALLCLVIWYFRDHLGNLLGDGENPGKRPAGSGGAPPPAADRAPTPTSWSWSVALAAGFVLALLGLGLAFFARRAGIGRGPATREEPAPEDVQQVVAAGRAALAQVDESRAAVIRAYAAMEAALGDLGLGRSVVETPTDLLERASRAGLFGTRGEEAAGELTRLFQRARFSRRELPPDTRLAAVAALDRLEAELRRTVRSRAGAAGEAG